MNVDHYKRTVNWIDECISFICIEGGKSHNLFQESCVHSSLLQKLQHQISPTKWAISSGVINSIYISIFVIKVYKKELYICSGGSRLWAKGGGKQFCFTYPAGFSSFSHFFFFHPKWGRGRGPGPPGQSPRSTTDMNLFCNDQVLGN